MKKISGVEKVEASLNKGKAFIQLKPGNTVKLEDLVQKVRDNAFHPKEARVTARGELVSSAGKLQLKVSGIDEVYELVSEAKAAKMTEDLKRNLGKTLLVEGIVPAPKNKNMPKVIQLQSFRAS
jgi:copper chaperone CopZ